MHALDMRHERHLCELLPMGAPTCLGSGPSSPRLGAKQRRIRLLRCNACEGADACAQEDRRVSFGGGRGAACINSS